jgi:hypothetical protein
VSFAVPLFKMGSGVPATGSVADAASLTVTGWSGMRRSTSRTAGTP